MIKKVHLLIDKSRIVDYSLLPLRFNKKRLFKRGYKLSFFYQQTEEYLSCDILLLFSKPVLQMLNEQKVIIEEPSPTVDLLKKAKRYSNKIIWMDTSDSTTVTHFELLPYVDLYLKKQLFKDRTLYQKDFVGGRIFTDYYHREFGVEDDIRFNQYYPLDLNYSDKVSLSWNIGLGDMVNSFSKINSLRLKYLSIVSANYKVTFVSPFNKKNIDIFIRTSSDLNRNLVAFHRKELLKRLSGIIKKNDLNGSIDGEWLSQTNFRNILVKTKILPSPFGWGELGVRDYEAFIYGALLLKPDISHMETWPSIFIKNETYVPFSWNFDDLGSTITDLLQDDKKRIKIAANGQEAYRDSISKIGMERFCDWFIQQIEK
ncbi:MAG: glycosyltransferase family 1 protein [Bacteroidetes bacterium]|nr:glycosyltransferase family 1 protein [Bacteroidota bacterium]